MTDCAVTLIGSAVAADRSDGGGGLAAISDRLSRLVGWNGGDLGWVRDDKLEGQKLFEACGKQAVAMQLSLGSNCSRHGKDWRRSSKSRNDSEDTTRC